MSFGLSDERMRALPLFAVAAVLAACPSEKKVEAADAAADAPLPAAVELTVLFTGSENGYLLATPGDDGQPRGGAAELLAKWMAKEGHCPSELAKSPEAPCREGDTLVLSTGDNGNGAAISSVFHGEPTAEVMRHMGYAASAFGNHEVDFGRPQFARNRELGGFPYLAANLPASADSDSAEPLGLQGSLIVKRKNLDIAIVGLTSPKTRSSTMPGRLDDVALVDDAQAMAALPTIAKADAVIVLTDGCLSDFAPVLEAHPEWRVAVAAGQQCNEAFPPHAGGAALVWAGRRFQGYGRAKLTFRGEQLTGVQAETVQLTPNEPAEAKVAELIGGWKKKLDDALGERIGFSKRGLTQDSPQLSTWLATALKEQTQADVGLVNAKGTRAGLTAGPITKASVFDLIPFENTVVVLKVPGETLRRELQNPEARFVGVKNAKAVDASKTYTVATNSFIYFGGDGFELKSADSKPDFTGETWQSAVIAWTQKQQSSEKKPLEQLLK